MRIVLICLITAAVLGGSFYFFSNTDPTCGKSETGSRTATESFAPVQVLPEALNFEDEDEPVDPDERTGSRQSGRTGSNRTLCRLASGDGVIKGRILDEETEEPVPGALIRLTWNYDSWDPDFAHIDVYSDTDGCFRISGLSRPQEAFFHVEKEGYALDGEWVYLCEDEPVLDMEDLYLEKGEKVTVRVKDFETAAPLPGATVVVRTMKDGNRLRVARMMSDENGMRVFWLPAGTYNIFTEAKSHVPASRDHMVVAGRENTVEFSLRKGKPITGVVLDEEGEPVPDVRVTADSNELYHNLGTRTDGEGRFLLSGCGDGHGYKLLFAADGFFPATWEGVKPGMPELSVEMNRLIILNGTVVDAETLEPVSSAYICVESEESDYEDDTDLTGEYQFRLNRSEKALVISACMPGYEEFEKKFTLPDGKCDGCTIDVALERGIALSGVVRDAENGRPLADVSVNVMMDDEDETDFYVTTDAKGVYIAGGLEPGKAVVTFDRTGYVFRVFTAVDITNSGGTLDAELETGGAIAGKVTDVEGRPVANINVYAEPHIPGQPIVRTLNTLTDNSGAYRITGATPGMVHAVVASGENHLGASKTVRVCGGKTQNLDFVLRRGASISGKIFYPGNEPCKHVNVSLLHLRPNPDGNSGKAGYEHDTSSSSSTDSKGAFRFAGLRPGEYILRASECNYADTTTAPVALDYGTKCENVEMVLDRGLSVSGRVFDDAGIPVKGASVRVNPKNASSKSCKTDENGFFTVFGLETGAVTVKAESDRYYGGKSISAEAGAQNVDLVLSRCGRIAGSITGPEEFQYYRISATRNGKGYYNRSMSYSGGGGKFELFVEPGEYTVSASGRNFVQSYVADVNVVPGCTTPLTINVRGGGALCAVVLDAADRKPVECAEVYVKSVQPEEEFPDEEDGEDEDCLSDGSPYDDYDYSRETDEKGKVKIEGLETGTCMVWASAYGYARTEQRAVTVHEGGKASVIFLLRRGATISGSVTGADGKPVRGAYILLGEGVSEPGENDYDRDTETGLSGTYEFKGLQPGRYNVGISWPGDGDDEPSESRIVDIAGDEKIKLDFKR